MSNSRLDLTSARNKILLAKECRDKCIELQREALRDAKNIIEKSNLARDLGDYFEEAKTVLSVTDCEACQLYYIVIRMYVTKDTPEEVKKRIGEVLTAALPETALAVHETDRTSQEKKAEKKKEVRSYE